jgi:hypothetical protein
MVVELARLTPPLLVCRSLIVNTWTLSTTAMIRGTNHTVHGHDRILARNIYLFIHNYLCVLGESMTPHPSFPPDLFLYVNLGAKRHRSFLRLWPSSLQYWVSLTFADAYSRTLRRIDLYNIRPIPRE